MADELLDIYLQWLTVHVGCACAVLMLLLYIIACLFVMSCRHQDPTECWSLTLVDIATTILQQQRHYISCVHAVEFVLRV